MQHFNELALPQPLMDALAKMNYTTPTPVQAQTIPLALAGHDVLGSAQTGTGKTAAFGIPLVAKLLSAPKGSALVLLPTRELAQQVLAVLKQLLGNNRGINTALLIGGDSMPGQFNQLRARPRLIVGTPGRINDHLERGSLMLHDVNFLVLDETDRMLDMGFAIQLEKIFKFISPNRQSLMFSATLPDNITKMSAKYLREAKRVAIGSTTATATKVTQEIIHTTAADKHNLLLDQLNKREGSIIVFVKTKHGADRLADRLNKTGHSANAIHGDLHQRKRESVINAFRNKKYRIMVATDIAARGLDIPHIEHVINFDLPQCPEDYIHRIGRTGRNDASGEAVCLLAPEDNDKWRAIHRLLYPNEAPPPRANGGRGRPGGGAPNGAAKPRRFNRNRRPGGQQKRAA